MKDHLTPKEIPTDSIVSSERVEEDMKEEGEEIISITEDLPPVSDEAIDLGDQGDDVITIESTPPPAVADAPTVVTVTDPTNTYKPLKDREYKDISAVLPTEFVTGEDLDKLHAEWVKKLKKVTNNKDRKAGEAKLENLYRMAINGNDGNYTSFFERELSEYVTSVPPVDGTVPIRMGHPRIDIPDNVEVLSGQSANLVISKQMRGGLVTKTPCWHSGLSLTNSAYGEKELIDYGINMSRLQMSLGTDSLGATFSGDDIFMIGPVLEMVLGHITDCQLKVFTPVTLRKTLRATDIPALLGGALESIYPDGYPIHHICVNPSCDYVLMAQRDTRGNFKPNALINFSNVLKVHRPSLTHDQIRHMSQIAKSTTVDAVLAYQAALDERLWDGRNNFVVWEETTSAGTESVAIVFKVPNLDEYMTMSYEWVANVTAMADAMVASEPAWKTPEQVQKAKYDYINTYASITDIVKNLCWVDHIVTTNAKGISRRVISRDDIRKQLENFIQTDGVKERFDKAVQEFKEMSIIAWTGIPNFACPTCGSSQTEPGSKTPSLIPLNMVGYFFSILVSRQQKRL